MSAIEPLWTGDSGTLTFDSRRALVQLLKGPLLRKSKHSELWSAVTTDTEALRSRLADVFLDLIVDEDAGIAFTRMAVPDNELKIPVVLRVDRLKHVDTLILLHLRNELGLSAPGERVIVDVEELRDQVRSYQRTDDLDDAAYNKRFNSAITRIRNTYHLLDETETEGRFEVSPVLRHIFDVDTVTALRDEYARYALSGAPTGAPAGESDTAKEVL
ncbi:DUF4194 domain-containing protein [Corynebacterium callunae]|uniref:DUF4194 domain-containing protein n=1 Tax=Corynebacterium callunae TaxID=1721 RepID=UPI0039823EDC